MNKNFLRFHAIAACLLWLVAHAAAQVLQDPNFDNSYNVTLTGTTTQTPFPGGWTFGATAGSGNTGSVKSLAGGQSGTAIQIISQHGSTDPVFAEQAVTGLVAGTPYAVSFYIEDGGGGGANPGTIQVFDGATLLGTFTNASQASYQQFTAAFTAQSTSDTLIFLDGTANTGKSHINLDTISVFSTTPEPMSIGGPILLLAGIGWIERRRIQRQAATLLRRTS